jgi:hypothetical protein
LRRKRPCCRTINERDELATPQLPPQDEDYTVSAKSVLCITANLER